MLRERLDEYIRNTSQIRELSNPDPAKLDSAGAYSKVLRDNFLLIGQIAQKNRAILSEVLEPLLCSKDPLPEEIVSALNQFSESLLDASSVNSLDIPLSYIVSVRLFEDAMQGDDPGRKLRQSDYLISSCYSMINLTKRLGFGADACFRFREYGFLAADYIKKFYDRHVLASLEEETLRELVLIDSRFMVCLYEGSREDAVLCQENLDILKRSADLAKNPAIRALVPHYDWRYHLFRCMEYAGATPEHNNSRGCTLAQRRYICEICERLLEIWDSDPAYYSNVSPRIYVKLETLKNQFLSGRLKREHYLDQLVSLYRECEESRGFSAAEEVHYIIGIPLEYIYALERPPGFVTKENDYVSASGPWECLTPKQADTLTRFYHMIEERALYTIGTSSNAYLLEFLSMLIMHFIEVPQVSCEEFCLSVMRALHPPTYVHSLMVGEISECLCGNVLRLAPEHLAGVRGYETVEDVRTHAKEILAFVRHAALCHDFGKIPLIDIIFVYGRRLFDFEFDLIREHPDLGIAMLERIPGMRAYGDIVRGHHKWHDNSDGYPGSFSLEHSKDAPLVDIVTCADCMDAATDTIGRSYNRGKTLDEYIAEVEEGSGTRYAAFLPKLLRDPQVYAQLNMILEKGREGYYRETYQKLVEKRM
ncbi:MAG TPA: hypothetical protein DHV42_01665 [Lachnospiraceae bacterium]|nr:hypothetical protein [Lachnospiraceae bacterium]